MLARVCKKINILLVSNSVITKGINTKTVNSPHKIEKVNIKAIDSKIVTYQHVDLISKWINKVDTSEKPSTLYEFKLMLRGSRDGFDSEKFHEICDNQSHTVSIVKVRDSNVIAMTLHIFIFSLKARKILIIIF